MSRTVHYATVTNALKELREKGFTLDFNLEENCVSCANGKFSADEFEIVEIYRYEGQTDPADEATVYGIESNSGLKGVLVTGYGISSEVSGDILKKLTISR